MTKLFYFVNFTCNNKSTRITWNLGNDHYPIILCGGGELITIFKKQLPISYISKINPFQEMPE